MGVGALLAGVDLPDVGQEPDCSSSHWRGWAPNVVGAPIRRLPVIEAARYHAFEETGARPAYRMGTVEELAGEPAAVRYRGALMEVIEHAADPKRFVATAASLVKPGGLLLVSTLNRTLRSFALAIVGAEYVPAGSSLERTAGSNS